MVPTYVHRLRKEVYLRNAGQMQSLCTGPAESWMWFMSHALNLPGYRLTIIQLGYCLAVVRSGLVGYSVAGFGYKLVSCTLSRLSHESVGGTGIWPMTLAPMVLQVLLEVNRFSRNVATRKPGPKTHWEKNGPRKGCCHGAVVGVACAIPNDNVFFRTSVRYVGRIKGNFELKFKKVCFWALFLRFNVKTFLSSCILLEHITFLLKKNV